MLAQFFLYFKVVDSYTYLMTKEEYLKQVYDMMPSQSKNGWGHSIINGNETWTKPLPPRIIEQGIDDDGKPYTLTADDESPADEDRFKDQMLESLAPIKQETKQTPYESAVTRLYNKKGSDILNAIREADIGKESSLVKKLPPVAIADLYSKMLNETISRGGMTPTDVYNAYDIPTGTSTESKFYSEKGLNDTTGEPNLNLMVNKPKLTINKNLADKMGEYGHYSPLKNELVSSGEGASNIIHEMAHVQDDRGYYPVDYKEINSEDALGKNGVGLGAALNTYEGHIDKAALIQRTALYNMIHGMPPYQTDRSFETPVTPRNSPAYDLGRDLNDIKNYAIDVEPFK